MTVYVDPLMAHGWLMRGRRVDNCHLFTDQLDLEELHSMAKCIGMKREWFQDKHSAPHYDLTESRRKAAIDAGAVPLERHEAVAIWRARRDAVARSKPHPQTLELVRP